MFILNENACLEFNGKTQRDIANKIGINEQTLSRILHKKQTCSKLIAYCLTKLNDENAEISDYFEYVENGD